MDVDSLPKKELLQEIILKQFREEFKGKMAPKLLDMEMETVTDSPGFLSDIIRVNLNWSRHENRNLLPQSLIYKIPSADKFLNFSDANSSGTKEITYIPKLHLIECNFYNLWCQEPSPCLAPICYLAQPISQDQQGILILQDASVYGSVPGLDEGLELDQLVQVVENLAHLQAWSLNPRNRAKIVNMEVPSMKHCDTFIEILRNSCKEMQSRWLDWFQTAAMDQAVQLFTTENYYYQFRPEAFEQLGMESVLVHGDIWAPNLMFSKEDHGARLVAILDWQGTHFGFSSEDLVRLIFLSCAPEVRRQHLDGIIGHFYDSLAKDLGEDPPFTLDQLMGSFQFLSKAGLILSLGNIAVVALTLDKKPGSGQQVESLLNRGRALLEDILPSLTNHLAST